MCGRFTLAISPKRLAQCFALDLVPQLALRYNIAPSQDVLAVRLEDDRRVATPLRWGLIPPWSKAPRSGLINARAETLAEKLSFKNAFLKRRCLIPADGFFEWQKLAGRKQPYYVQLEDRQPFAFAGLWERWEGAKPVESCTLITTTPNALMKPLHHRMPVILDPQFYDVWLDPTIQDPDYLKPLLRPFPSEAMHAYPVNPHVNSPSHDDAACVEPVKVGQREDVNRLPGV